jgi:hypothetical protein
MTALARYMYFNLLNNNDGNIYTNPALAYRYVNLEARNLIFGEPIRSRQPRSMTSASDWHVTIFLSSPQVTERMRRSAGNCGNRGKRSYVSIGRRQFRNGEFRPRTPLPIVSGRTLQRHLEPPAGYRQSTERVRVPTQTIAGEFFYL